MNRYVILYTIGIILMVEAAGMMLCALAGFFFGDVRILYMVLSSLTAFYIGGILYLTMRNSSRGMGKREVYALIVFGWLAIILFGSMPYLWSKATLSFTDAFFESLSGFTTTGATIFDSPELLPRALLLWRGLTQWFGGIAILILSLAILPTLGIGGLQLFVTTTNLPSGGKLHPRISEAAKRLLAIYFVITFLQVFCLILAGMPLFDSLAHSLATISTGGFSVHSQNISHYPSAAIQNIFIVFMLLSGINFSLAYFGATLNFKYIIKNEEVRWFLGIVLFFAFALGIGLIVHEGLPATDSLRLGLFHAVSIITTTGFYITDYSVWHPMFVSLVLMMMLIGGSSGTSAGGIKVLRVSLMLRNVVLELKRIVHPNAVLPLRYNGMYTDNAIVTNVLVYMILYLVLIVAGTLFASILGLGFKTSLVTMMACLGNIGPGIGDVGPYSTYAAIPAVLKWFYMAVMFVGRFEIFGFLLLFFPSFWRR